MTGFHRSGQQRQGELPTAVDQKINESSQDFHTEICLGFGGCADAGTGDSACS